MDKIPKEKIHTKNNKKSDVFILRLTINGNMSNDIISA